MSNIVMQHGVFAPWKVILARAQKMTTQPVLQHASLVELRRIYIQHLSRAITKIGHAQQRVDIHGARNELKRGRALLRLLRDAVGETTYRRTNISLRDVARPLSAARDAEVLLDLIDDLRKRHRRKLPSRGIAAVRRNLQQEKLEGHSSAVMSGRRRALVMRLRTIQREARLWKLAKNDAHIITSGLQRTYRSARRARALARDTAKEEHLHEWRKQTKYLWHELEVFEALVPKHVRKFCGDLHQLADYLGDDHDLAVLAQRTAHPSAASSVDTFEVLENLIAKRRSRLQKKAFVLGGDLLRTKPASFAKQFHKVLRKHDG